MGRGSGGGFNKQRKGTPKSNQAQNRQTDAIARLLKLTPKQQRQLHDELSGKGYSYQKILEIAKNMFGK